MSEQSSSFIFATCQLGAENVLKNEMKRLRPEARFSFSRRGFLTFRLPENSGFPQKISTSVAKYQTVFARGWSNFLGKIDAKDFDFRSDLALDHIWKLCLEDFSPENPNHRKKINRIHVWERDASVERTRTSKAGSPPERSLFERLLSCDDSTAARRASDRESRLRSGLGTKRIFEPGLTSFARRLHAEIFRSAPSSFADFFASDADNPEASGVPGEICLDCVPVTENELWIGFHKISDYHSRFPGGLIPLQTPIDAVSRAWLKFEEGLRWSNFPIGGGSRCVDIGASPGGGSQALLARGAEVLGVDPAEIDPVVLNHPNFTHLRGKINQLKRKLFRKSRWFLTDMNVAPNYTLDALEEIVGRSDVPARGLLFTLKLFDWNLAENIPDYVRRIQSWGFPVVKTRQLTFNHQEIMVACSKEAY